MSPKTVAFVKLGIAAVGLIHAIDEVLTSSPGKRPIGFHKNNDDLN